MIMFHPKIIVWAIPPLSDKNKLILLLVYPDSIHILSSFFPMKSPCLTRNPPKCEVRVHPAPKLGSKILSSYSCQVFPWDVSDFSSLDPVFFPTFPAASSIASVWRQNFSSASLDRASDHGEWLAWNPLSLRINVWNWCQIWHGFVAVNPLGSPCVGEFPLWFQENRCCFEN